MNKYDDIINLNRPKSKYPCMSLYDRAAQFAPFAALTTHGDAIRETARLTSEKIDLGEEEIDVINSKLQYIYENISKCLIIMITYFIPDDKKYGGSYVTIKKKVKKLDLINKKIVLFDNINVNFNDIIYLDIIENI